MTKHWPMVPLGEVLTHRKEFIQIDDAEIYKRCRVKLHAQGIVLRDEVPGSEIKTKKQQVCKAGEFLVAEIDAKVGGFGIVPDVLDTAIVSSHYFLFQVIEPALDKTFLNYFIRTPFFRDQVTAQGSTNYAAIRPKEVLGYKIPHPPLSEQKRIVARIEELAAKIEEARGLRQKAVEEAESLILSSLLHFNSHPHWEQKCISDCSEMSTGTTPPSERTEYFGGPLQWYTPGDLNYQRQLGRSTRTLSETAVRDGKARLFSAGTVLLVAIGGSLGKVGMAHEQCSANQQITGIKFNTEIQPEYGFWWMRRLGKDLMAAAPQATLPIINQTRIGQFQIVIPPLPDQRRIVAYLDGLQTKVDALKQLQAETAKELDAMMPSVLDRAFRGEF